MQGGFIPEELVGGVLSAGAISCFAELLVLSEFDVSRGELRNFARRITALADTKVTYSQQPCRGTSFRKSEHSATFDIRHVWTGNPLTRHICAVRFDHSAHRTLDALGLAQVQEKT